MIVTCVKSTIETRLWKNIKSCINKILTVINMDIPDEILTELSYVKISQYRTKVMSIMDREELKIPSQIAEESDIIQNHISKTIKQLKDHELIECVNPEVKQGKLYRLTETGEKVAEFLDSFNLG